MTLNNYNLLSPRCRNVELKWDDDRGFDSEKDFKKNQRRLGNAWIYYNKKITYNLNEFGFRTKPFNEVNWSESIVILGCSNTYGAGLALEDTISSILEEEIGIPVINLGVSGSAVDLACWNSLIIYNFFPKPKAIVQLWTNFHRYSDISKNYLYNIFSWHPHKSGFSLTLDWAERSKLYILADNTLWINKIPYYQASWFADSAKTINCDYFETIDNARDCQHPGIESNKIAAKKIKDELKKQGL